MKIVKFGFTFKNKQTKTKKQKSKTKQKRKDKNEGETFFDILEHTNYDTRGINHNNSSQPRLLLSS